MKKKKMKFRKNKTSIRDIGFEKTMNIIEDYWNNTYTLISEKERDEMFLDRIKKVHDKFYKSL